VGQKTYVWESTFLDLLATDLGVGVHLDRGWLHLARSALGALGMKQAFTNAADLSGTTTSAPLHLSGCIS
jgi:hypothetical protein